MIRSFLLMVLFPFFIFGEAPYHLLQRHDCGFFSCFLITIGMLDTYENGQSTGCEVNFGKTGLYYSPTHGDNWWEYYFAPVKVGRRTQASCVESPQPVAFANKGLFILSRSRCNELIKKYIKIKPAIRYKLQKFVTKKLGKQPFIGVHYRGTDHFPDEIKHVSKAEACDAVVKASLQFPPNTKIFVATDEAGFVDLMRSRFGERIVCFDMQRSTDGTALHGRKDVDGYITGEQVLLDCLVLSQAALLIRTSSNVSATSLLFNPTLPSNCLNGTRGLDRDAK